MPHGALNRRRDYNARTLAGHSLKAAQSWSPSVCAVHEHRLAHKDQQGAWLGSGQGRLNEQLANAALHRKVMQPGTLRSTGVRPLLFVALTPRYRTSASRRLSGAEASGGVADEQLVMNRDTYSALTAEQVAHGTIEAAKPIVAESPLAATWRMPRTALLCQEET